LNVFAYESSGFWEYLENVNKYYQITMQMIKKDNPINLVDWEIVTNPEDRSLGTRNPVFMGRGANIKDSLISPGCRIEGTVSRSVLSPGVIVEEGATVMDSIIMHDSIIRKESCIQKVISDKNVTIEQNCSIGGEMRKDKNNPELPDSPLGLTILGKGAIIGEDIKIGGLSQVYPGMDLRSYSGTHFAPGVNIK
jgi:glucose-1-phosphate adenylyltransferase